MAADDLQRETTDVLRELVRFNTVNPPGNERPAIEFLASYLRDAGLKTELLADDEDRPNLVADLTGNGSGDDAGPTLCYLGHVDTVLADAVRLGARPVVGRRRRRVPVGPRGARHEVPGRRRGRRGRDAGARGVAAARWDAEARVRLRRGDRRRRGCALADRHHPDKVRCDMLLNEGAGEMFEFGGRRRYGVCCAEKGIFRFKLTARGAAGHASLPSTGDNALLKLGPVLDLIAARQPSVRADRGAGGAARAGSTSTPTTRPARSSASRRSSLACSSSSSRCSASP